METLNDIIPRLLRRIRKENGLSQEDLAYLAGLDRTYVSGIERGVRNITLKTLDKILTALQVDINKFATELIIQYREELLNNKRNL